MPGRAPAPATGTVASPTGTTSTETANTTED